MDSYCLVQMRDGQINSRRYFSSKEKVIEWLNNLILQICNEYLVMGRVQVSQCKLIIDWIIYRDEYYIEEIKLVPFLDDSDPDIDFI